ncbi:unnamed protein product [Paramecium sonneborni]|uniref:Transmembrane protein n=1 Tax=Paramecium sonneborni TaxID=65129 RepID=A0A8S1MQF0_9CILI|nr:unnamed protein product [Paramecium sonneborni]
MHLYQSILSRMHFIHLILDLSKIYSLNFITNNIIFDHRVPFVIYQGSIYIYLKLDVYSIIKLLSNFKSLIQIFGIIVYIWYLEYFIVFWAAPWKSLMLPQIKNNFNQILLTNFQLTVGQYWKELILNLNIIDHQLNRQSSSHHQLSRLSLKLCYQREQ